MRSEAAFLNGRTPAHEDLMKLRYSRMVVEEKHAALSASVDSGAYRRE